MDIERLSTTVATWASSEPLVRKAYFFGSRVRGSHKPESDLDVAVELLPMPGDENLLATWIGEARRLTASLSTRLPVSLDLQWYGGPEETPTVHAGLQAGNLVIYELLPDKSSQATATAGFSVGACG
jgi:predicted nucleotidyltransferase